MNMRSLKSNLSCVALVIIILNLSSCKNNEKTPVDCVNPYIGNISHLLVPTYPTVHLPNSMMRVHPQREDYTSTRLSGLPVFLPSHRGNQVFNLLPFQENSGEFLHSGSYEYDNEIVKPYYYEVYLNNVNTEVKFAPAHQSAIYELNYKGINVPYLIIRAKGGALSVVSNTVSGWQFIHNTQTKVYLYLETEQAPVETSLLQTDETADVKLKFDLNERIINIRYGISFISEEQAKRNLYREIANYNIASLAEQGRSVWNETLGKIKVNGTENDKILFYTALYRTYERMINISEDSNYYSGFDKQVHEDEGISFYTDDWVWDTYRAVHPLRILIEPEMQKDIVQSYIRMAQQSPEGWMPTFPEVTGDSHRMNGNHAVSVILDAYSKGLLDIDLKAVYDACKGAICEKSLLPWVKIPNTELDVFYQNKGFYPALDVNEQEYVAGVDSWEKRQSVAITLGACYDYWCLSKIAEKLDCKEEQACFTNRSFNYTKIYNPETAFFHPRNQKGDFIEPLDYRFPGDLGARNYYDENNGWTYRWDVSHNVANLIELMGGNANFIKNLDQTFQEPLGRPRYEFYAKLPDHTGNVGQFAMGNEPSLHIPYLYNYAGMPWRTQKQVRSLLEQWFRNDLTGIPGDEDGGGLSAFVVFSQLGFYPVTPGLPMYVIGSPVFEQSEIQLDKGKTFKVVCTNYAQENKYIQSAKLNGAVWNKSWFSHDDLMKGGKLELVMGKFPNKQWASDNEAVPPSFEMK
jgi:predicted alpha-1,2-mannosidase